jgi:hypothetical protein
MIDATAIAEVTIAIAASASVTGFLIVLRHCDVLTLRTVATLSRDDAARVIFPSSAFSNSSIEPHLSAGILSSAISSALATLSGTLGLSERTLRGRSVNMRAITACIVLPVCGGSLLSISYVTAASE